MTRYKKALKLTRCYRVGLLMAPGERSPGATGRLVRQCERGLMFLKLSPLLGSMLSTYSARVDKPRRVPLVGLSASANAGLMLLKLSPFPGSMLSTYSARVDKPPVAPGALFGMVLDKQSLAGKE